MADPLHLHLSRRESQIMDVVYHLGEASVAEVVERMPDGPSYNTVRNTMAILERKGHLRHRREGQRYLFAPADSVDQAKRSAMSHLLHTFFQGSLPSAVLALLGTSDRRLTEEELDEIAAYIERARKEAR
ncbi:MAG TPA: BlaI/MecI/CopY family transcriptional regulator [Longimicrobiaceae bacterium]|nr:BlaI/MecI/CopY family transcriptional regulator [Longimicrobiaceae bacterium]